MSRFAFVVLGLLTALGLISPGLWIRAYRRAHPRPSFFVRLLIATRVAERGAAIVAMWIAAVARSLWPLAGLVAFLAASWIMRRRIVKRQERIA